MISLFYLVLMHTHQFKQNLSCLYYFFAFLTFQLYNFNLNKFIFSSFKPYCCFICVSLHCSSVDSDAHAYVNLISLSHWVTNVIARNIQVRWNGQCFVSYSSHVASCPWRFDLSVNHLNILFKNRLIQLNQFERWSWIWYKRWEIIWMHHFLATL